MSHQVSPHDPKTPELAATNERDPASSGSSAGAPERDPAPAGGAPLAPSTVAEPPPHPQAAPTYRAALDARREELEAIPSESVRRGASIDVSRAASAVEASLTKVARHRGLLIAEFGERARVVLDTLLVTALAARQCDIEVTRFSVSSDVSPSYAATRRAYDLLWTDARSLVNHGLFEASWVEVARPIQGYDALIQSVLVLVSLFREKWESLEEHTPITSADLDAAELAAQEMNTAMALRDHAVRRFEAVELRARALTKLMKDYDSLRRMVTFVRWEEGDADEMAPSLWAKRGRKRRRAAERDGEAAETSRTATAIERASGAEVDPSARAGGPFTE
jgi:hypothetical protein